jgi:hypothetical protein
MIVVVVAINFDLDQHEREWNGNEMKRGEARRTYREEVILVRWEIPVAIL